MVNYYIDAEVEGTKLMRMEYEKTEKEKAQQSENLKSTLGKIRIRLK